MLYSGSSTFSSKAFIKKLKVDMSLQARMKTNLGRACLVFAIGTGGNFLVTQEQTLLRTFFFFL